MKPTRTSSQPKRIIHINIRQRIFHGIIYNLCTSLKLLFFHKNETTDDDPTGYFIPATKRNVRYLPHSPILEKNEPFLIAVRSMQVSHESLS